MKKEILKIAKIVKAGKKFLVAAHLDPEGDAIGSTLAVFNYLNEKGKGVDAYNRDPVPSNLKFLKNSSRIKNSAFGGGKKYDATFILDCSEFSRVSDDFGIKKENLGTIINIDHHITSKGSGTVNIIDPEASSAAEIIYMMLKGLNYKFSRATAEAIYTAVLTDTGSFRYSNSTSRAFRIASELVELGVDPWKVAQNVYENFPPSRLKLTSMVLSTLEIREDEKFASIVLLKDMIEKTNALPEFSDGLINYPRSIEGMEVAIMFKESKMGEFKICFRSKGTVDVAKIAGGFGGGGHRNAAGCTVKGDLNYCKEKIYERTRIAIREKFGNNPCS